MKRLVLLIVPLFLAVFTGHAQWRFSVDAGSSFNQYYTNHHNQNGTGDNVLPGFRLGTTASYTFKVGVRLETGLWYNSNHGGELYNINKEEYAFIDKMTQQSHYLQIPLYLGYRIRLMENFSIVPKIGLWGGVGLAGKRDIEGTDGAGHDYYSSGMTYNDTEIGVMTSEGVMGSVVIPAENRFDYGVSVGIDVQSGPIVVRGSCDFGLSNLNPGIGNYSFRMYSLTVGYQF